MIMTDSRMTGSILNSVNSELDLIEFNSEIMVTEWSVRTRIITASSSLFEKTENSNELQTLMHRQHYLFVSLSSKLIS